MIAIVTGDSEIIRGVFRKSGIDKISLCRDISACFGFVVVIIQ